MAGRRVEYELRYRTESVVAGSKRIDTSLKKSDTQFKKTGKEVDKLRGKTKKLTDAQKNSGAGFAAGTKQTKAATGQMNKLGSTIGSVNGLVAGLGITFGGLMIVRMLKGWISEAVKFDKELQNIQTDIKFLGEEAVPTRGELKGMFRDISVGIGTAGGIREVANAYDEMITTEWSLIDAEKNLDDVMEITTVRGHEVKDAVDLTSYAMRNFNKTAGDTYEILSMADMAATRGHLSFAELTKATGMIGDKFAYAGGTMEEWFAINQELSRDKKGRKMLSDLGLATEMLMGQNEQQVEVLKRLGVENGTFIEKLKALKKAYAEDSNVLNELTNSSSNYNRILLNLINRTDDLEEASLNYGDAVKIMKEASTEYYESQDYQLQQLTNRWKEYWVEISGGLLRVVDSMSGSSFLPNDRKMELNEMIRKLKGIETGVEDVTEAQDLYRLTMEAKYPGYAWYKPPPEGEDEEAPPTGGAPGAPAIREKTPEEEIAEAIRVIDAKLKREKAGDEWLLDTREQGRIVALESEFELRSAKEDEIEHRREANAKIVGDLAGDTLVAAISGGDVLGALKSTFYDTLGNLISMAFSMIPGIGGLLSFLPFEKGGIFDSVHAEKGKIFKPRPGGYHVIAGEPGTRGEAFVPNTIYGKELVAKHLIPDWFPELQRAEMGAVYGGGNGGQSPVVNVEVPILVSQLDPQRITAARTVKEASYARARTQG